MPEITKCISYKYLSKCHSTYMKICIRSKPLQTNVVPTLFSLMALCNLTFWSWIIWFFFFFPCWRFDIESSYNRSSLFSFIKLFLTMCIYPLTQILYQPCLLLIGNCSWTRLYNFFTIWQLLQVITTLSPL